jgi:hypothetical protein
MIRTQIQLPNQLHQRAKRWAEAHECSLAEVTRRGVEMLLERYPEPDSQQADWKIPVISTGGIRVNLEDLRDVLFEIESGGSGRDKL